MLLKLTTNDSNKHLKTYREFALFSDWDGDDADGLSLFHQFLMPPNTLLILFKCLWDVVSVCCILFVLLSMLSKVSPCLTSSYLKGTCSGITQ